MSQSQRLFVALELPHTIKIALAGYVAPLQQLGRGVRWVKPENVHLTVKFLGDTPNAKLAAIQETLATVCSDFPRLVIEIAGAGVFPNARRPQVLWVGLNDASGQLGRLAQEIDARLHQLGFPRETRPFSPHATIGRVRDARIDAIVKEMLDHPFPPHEMICPECTLMQSELHRAGSVYTPVQKFGFGDDKLKAG